MIVSSDIDAIYLFHPSPTHTHTHTHTHALTSPSHLHSPQYGNVFSFTMVGKTFTYLIGSDSSALFFNSKNEDLNAEEVYSKLVTPVFGKGVAYDVPNKVFFIGHSVILHLSFELGKWTLSLICRCSWSKRNC